jgi:chaperonin cofactor prefoldin
MAGRQGEQELMELQQKLMMVSRDLNEVQVKINLNQRNKRRAELTQAELQGLAPDAKTYKSTGTPSSPSPSPLASSTCKPPPRLTSFA